MAKHLGVIATQSYLAALQWGKTGHRRQALGCDSPQHTVCVDRIKQGWAVDQLIGSKHLLYASPWAGCFPINYLRQCSQEQIKLSTYIRVTEAILKHGGESPAAEQKHFRILHPSLPRCWGLSWQLPIDFPCVPLFNLVQYFSNLTVQNNHCPAYRQQILFSVLHSQFQDISRVFSGSLHELDQVEPGAHMPARGWRAETQTVPYRLADSAGGVATLGADFGLKWLDLRPLFLWWCSCLCSLACEPDMLGGPT